MVRWPHAKSVLLLKVKYDKPTARVIHDISRSGANHMVRPPERVALPRLSDAIAGLQRLARIVRGRPCDTVEMMVLVVCDAFKHVPATDGETRLLPGHADGTLFIHLTL